MRVSQIWGKGGSGVTWGPPPSSRGTLRIMNCGRLARNFPGGDGVEKKGACPPRGSREVDLFGRARLSGDYNEGVRSLRQGGCLRTRQPEGVRLLSRAYDSDRLSRAMLSKNGGLVAQNCSSSPSWEKHLPSRGPDRSMSAMRLS